MGRRPPHRGLHPQARLELPHGRRLTGTDRAQFSATPFSLWPLCGRLVVTLNVMSDTKHVVLIHGTWSRGVSWAPARAAFEERGYIVHTPTLRHHELPLQEGAMKIAPLSMRGSSGASSGGTFYSRGRGPSRCIPRRGSGFGGGQPTLRPRRRPARCSLNWSVNRGAPTARCSSHFWTGEGPPPSTSQQSRRQCSQSGANATFSCRHKSPQRQQPGIRRAPLWRSPGPTISSFSGTRYPSPWAISTTGSPRSACSTPFSRERAGLPAPVRIRPFVSERMFPRVARAPGVAISLTGALVRDPTSQLPLRPSSHPCRRSAVLP